MKQINQVLPAPISSKILEESNESLQNIKKGLDWSLSTKDFDRGAHFYIKQLDR